MPDAEYDLIVIGAGAAGTTAALASGPAMLAYLEKHAGFVFRSYPHHPDYRQELPGAALGGRPLESPHPGAGAQLGPGMTFAYRAALHAVRRQEQAMERRAA